ncbi:GNAT family N-acetyltransferase [Azospirillum halopraeferens]|uniref:GNAT family N-acetyltransferase n=1 Tax=Azospirillum halopraeferens TaxID=34010 RepID=UPI000423BACB|nr:GNAT family N-acetyltransferase [Azospirillum halopraeferens]
MAAGWRAMGNGDIAAVLDVAEVVHSDYPERPEVFAERLQLFPAGCRVAVAGDGTICGYAVLHPGVLGKPPALDSLLGALPADADCLYLHDVALLPQTRGLGLGEAALRDAAELARCCGLEWLALTSTPPARGYWERAGFAPFAGADAALAAKLASYGDGMAYLVAPSFRPMSSG